MLAGPQDLLPLGRLMAETTFPWQLQMELAILGGYPTKFLDRCILSTGDMLELEA
jgi:hypothetical protein